MKELAFRADDVNPPDTRAASVDRDAPPAQPTVAELVQCLARDRKDEAAWAAFFDRLWPWVLAHAYRELGGARDWAVDAAQEVFVRIFRYCPFEAFADEPSFRKYAATVCIHVCHDLVKKALRRREVAMPAAAEEFFADLDDVPADQLSEARDRLDQVVAALDTAERDLVHRLRQGHSLQKIADETGTTYSNA